MSVIMSRKIVHGVEEMLGFSLTSQKFCKALKFLKAVLFIGKFVSTSKACLLD